MSKSKSQSVWDKIWRDAEGNISIVEMPNIPIAMAALFLIVSNIFSQGRLHISAQYIYFGFLFTWAWLEISTGKSYFRRALGALVLIAIIYSHSR